MGIAEDRRLEWELGAAIRTKPVQLVDKLEESAHWPVGYIQGDPNKTVSDLPHVDTIREKLRAGAKDEKASPKDREAARQALRIMYRE